MRCPVCRAVYRPDKDKLFLTSETEEVKTPSASACRRCGADLSSLIQIHDRALWYHRQALQLFKHGYYSEAKASNEQALTLHQNDANFHTLAGRLWALEGEFRQAAFSWQKALRIDPQQSLAASCLQILTTAAQYR